MKRLLLAVLLASWLPFAHAGITVTDDRGTVVTLAAPPARIVSLLPSLTEAVCELGGCARLVATDRYSNHPTSVRALPKTGGLDDANIETIVALKPDVVLLGLSSRVIDRLEALGLTVVVLEPRTNADVRRVLGRLGLLLAGPEGAAAGERVWKRLQHEIDAAAHTVPAEARGLSVYYEVDSAPYAAGEASFIGETLARLHAKNIVPASLGPFPKLNPEFVVRADPQLIMVHRRSANMLGGRPGWQNIRAIRQQRVCRFSADEGDVLSRPGPRIGEAARLMARCLREIGGRR